MRAPGAPNTAYSRQIMSQNHGRDAPAINSTKKSSLFEVPYIHSDDLGSTNVVTDECPCRRSTNYRMAPRGIWSGQAPKRAPTIHWPVHGRRDISTPMPSHRVLDRHIEKSGNTRDGMLHTWLFRSQGSGKWPSALCAKCGENKDMSGGKICEKGHFLCHSCQKQYTKCPLDQTKMS